METSQTRRDRQGALANADSRSLTVAARGRQLGKFFFSGILNIHNHLRLPHRADFFDAESVISDRLDLVLQIVA